MHDCGMCHRPADVAAELLAPEAVKLAFSCMHAPGAQAMDI